MQIPSKQFADAQIRAMSTLQRELQDVQTRIATGNQLLTPIEDPAAAQQIALIDDALASEARRATTLRFARGQVQLREDVLNDALTVLTRVKEIAITGANGTMAPSDRANLATETFQQRESLRQLSNTANEVGAALFGGFQTRDAPFVQQSDTVEFRGDQGVQLLPGVDLPIGIATSGASVFGRIETRDGLTDVFAIVGAVGTALQTGGDVGETLEDIGDAIAHFSNQLAALGTSLQEIERLVTANTASDLALQERRSALADADIASLAAVLTQGLTTLQAAQHSFIRVGQMSLFDLLK